eukprot:scaffold1626_cov372-Prasinococcus_capsulatus_cf.AAC.7
MRNTAPVLREGNSGILGRGARPARPRLLAARGTRRPHTYDTPRHRRVVTPTAPVGGARHDAAARRCATPTPRRAE